MKQPLLSICIPTYNRKKHIQRLVSFFERELKDTGKGLVEVIISNNCSNDGTFEFLEALRNKFTWLFINHNDENIGGFRNMQKLIYMANGKYLWMPGDDDYLKIGIVASLIDIMQREIPGYIFMTRSIINEETKKVDRQEKKYCIEYDGKTIVTHVQMTRLLLNSFSDFKFQTSSVFLTENCRKYDAEANSINRNAREACHSLYKAVRSMQEETSYFISETLILSGDQISWSDQKFMYGTLADYEFSHWLKKIGFTKKECERISNFQLARDLSGCFTEKDLMKKWKENGKPGNGLGLYFAFIILCFRKVLRYLCKAILFSKKEIEKKQFGI